MAQKKLVWQIGVEEGEAVECPLANAFAPYDSAVSPSFDSVGSEQSRSSTCSGGGSVGGGCGSGFFRRMRLNRSIHERSRSVHFGFRYYWM